ncbi:hypothetical protein [Flavobacterium hydatis]|uniref:Uncharacterized protein n=1 Tax=Flavobacterium hydatis TaxID=991 RepID=A0A086AKZ7_FLAHY|nr:hypothetical protein [Flavobacterium hydatis]KFF17361.1 hypothetical protein IW20_08455 [Flavobacterium hydatis]OXA97341.1 hypothetical protein B0A62_03575 [Flavobacterium hydatis]
MIIINEEETGLGKPKFLKKIRLRNVSLKNAIKVTKFAAPIAAGFIPVGGGVASKFLSSKGGKLVSRIAKSKAVRKGISLSKTPLGRKVVSAVQNQSRPQIEAVSTITPATFAATSDLANPQNESSTYNESVESVTSDSQPVGELMPVRPATTAKGAIAEPTMQMSTAVEKPKNNTLLYVLGAVVLGGGIYLATKKSK